MSARTIPTHIDRYGEYLQSEVVFIEDARDGSQLHTVTVVPKGKEARQKFQGPKVPGPWAFTNLHASVIDNYGGTGAERARVPLDRRFIIGEPVRVEGLPGTHMFVNRDHRRLEGDGVKLVPYGV